MSLVHRLASAYFPEFLEARLLRRMPNPRVAVLMYHEVLPDHVDLPSWLVVKESAFRTQMRHLKQHYQVVSLEVALEHLRQGTARELQRPLAAITFDDGYAGNLNCAQPILAELGLPCTVYVATSKIEAGGRFWYDDVICALLSMPGRTLSVDTSQGKLAYSGSALGEVRRWAAINRFLSGLKALPESERVAIARRTGDPAVLPELRMLTPEELCNLAEAPGVTIGNHTHTHLLLDQVTLSVARDAIEQAQVLLNEWTGRRSRHFSYPNGNYVPETAALVRELGFVTAVTTRPGPWTTADSAHEIPRLGVGRFDNLNLVRAKAAGLTSGPLR